jgi:hypothetical protein
MVAMNRLFMADLARQKRVEVDLNHSADLTRDHSVGQAVEHYLRATRIQDQGLRWAAFSRGIMLDSKSPLRELTPEDEEWTVMPEVSAG